MQKYWSDTALIFGYPGYSWEKYTSTVTSIRTDWGKIPQSAHSKVLEALRTDCLKGNVTLEVQKDTVVLDPVHHLFASVSPEEYLNMVIMSVSTGQSMD